MCKACVLVGQGEAILTGSLAGHNAVRACLGIPLLILPKTLAIGDLIAYANEMVKTKKGRRDRYTFAGANYFKRMLELGLYTLDIEEIRSRVEKVNLKDIMSQKLI